MPKADEPRKQPGEQVDRSIQDWVETNELKEAREKARRPAEEARDEQERLRVLKAQLEEVRDDIAAQRQPAPAPPPPPARTDPLLVTGIAVFALGIVAGLVAWLLSPEIDLPEKEVALPLAEDLPASPPPTPARPAGAALATGVPESELGTLTIKSNPPARARVGSVRLGTGGWSGKVAAGTHEVELRTADGRQMVQAITVQPGQEAVLCWDFDLMRECGDDATSGRPEGLKRQ